MAKNVEQIAVRKYASLDSKSPDGTPYQVQICMTPQEVSWHKDLSDVTQKLKGYSPQKMLLVGVSKEEAKQVRESVGR